MDHLQSVIAARAESLGLSSYEISKRCEGSPNPEAVKRYLTGRCGLGSAYLSKICDVLGLELRPKGRKKKSSGKVCVELLTPADTVYILSESEVKTLIGETKMQTINWTAGTGAKIEVNVSVGFELNRQGVRKESGQKVVIVTANVNGADHFCPMGLQKTNHPVAVAKLGQIGLTAANRDRIEEAIEAAELEIESHNAALDAHEDKLNAVDAKSAEIAKSMSHGER